MRRRQVNRARAIVDALTLPDPWNVDELIAAVARQTGRPIELHGRPAMNDSITGTIFRLDEVDVLYYREDLEGYYRDHVKVHELGHILAGHLSGPGAYVLGVEDGIAGAIGVMLRRQCEYGEEREREAEDIADLVLARVRQRVPGVRDAATRRSVRGFAAALR